MLNTLMSLERIIVHNSAKVGEDQNMEGFDSSLNKNYKFYSVGFSETHWKILHKWNDKSVFLGTLIP